MIDADGMTTDEALAAVKRGIHAAEVVEEIIGPMCALCNTRIHQGDPDQYVEVSWRRTFKGGTSVIARTDTGRHAPHALRRRVEEERTGADDDRMSLLNYTTTVPAVMTAQQVQGLLVRAGASSITARYDGAEIIGLTFVVDTHYGPPAVLAAGARRRRATHAPGRPEDPEAAEDDRAGAARGVADHEGVAGKAQLAIIETEMVTLDQVMFPYMEDTDGTTLYELYVHQQLALESGA